MKRLALSICVCGSLAAMSAPASFGFAANFDYIGAVKGEPGSSVGFFVEHPEGGPKRVTGFTATGVPYDCRDALSGVTVGWRFKPRMRVIARRFDRRGAWVGLPLDPVGRVSGKLRRGGAVAGDLKLRGELAGPGTHCRTAVLDWRATKNQPLAAPASDAR